MSQVENKNFIKKQKNVKIKVTYKMKKRNHEM